MRIVSALFNALAFACTVAIVCVRSIVVCMHVNVGALFLGALALSFAAFALVLRKMQPRAVLRFSIAFFALCLVLLVVLFAFVFPEQLAAQPARVPKMALHLPATPNAWLVNVPLLAVFAALLATIARWARRA